MKKIIGLLFLMWSSISFASFSGRWNGWGTWSYQGSETNCDSMTLTFIETKDKLIRKGGYFDCQILGLEIDAKEWNKEGKNLTIDGLVVGTINDNSIHLTEQYSETIKVDSDIVRAAGHFDYNETWYDKDDFQFYQIKGRFFKM